MGARNAGMGAGEMMVVARLKMVLLGLLLGAPTSCAPSPLYVASGPDSAPGSVPRDVNGDPILPSKAPADAKPQH